jgi:hypothetical protein
VDRNEIRKIKFVTISFLIFIVTVIGSIRAYDDINRIKSERTKNIDIVFRQLKYIFEEKLEKLSNEMTHRALLLSNLNEVSNFIRNGDRDGLYEFVKNRYNGLRYSYTSFNRIHFHLKDGTSFLRVHNPKKFGDNLRDKRPMIDYVIKTKNRAVGFENGTSDIAKVTFRVAVPIFSKDGKKEFLGVMEFGVDFAQLVRDTLRYMEKLYPNKIYAKILFHKNAFNENNIKLYKNFDNKHYFYDNCKNRTKSDTHIVFIRTPITETSGHPYRWHPDILLQFPLAKFSLM